MGMKRGGHEQAVQTITAVGEGLPWFLALGKAS